MALTALQERFVQSFASDPRSATAAYRRAGGTVGSGASVAACRLLQHPAVAEGIRREQERFFQEQHRIRDDLFFELKKVINCPNASATEKLRAAELLCKLFGLL